MGLIADQGRGELDHGVASVIRPAVEAVVEKGLREEATQQSFGLVFVKGLAGFLVFDEFDSVEVSGASNVSHDRKVAELLEGPAESALVLLDVVVDAFRLEQIQVRHRHGSTNRVTSPGVPVEESVGSCLEGFEETITGDHGSHGGVAGGHPFRAGDDVRSDAEALDGEHISDAPERGDRLVGNHQDVVFVADFAHPVQVARGWREAAAGILHRLDEDRGDAIGTFELDCFCDSIRRPKSEGLLVVLEFLRRPIKVGVGHFHTTGNQWLEGNLGRWNARDAQGTLGCAVVGDRSTNDFVLRGLAGHLEILFGEFPRRFDGLTSSGGKEDTVEVSGRVMGKTFGESDRAGVGVGPNREEGEFFGLLRGRGSQFGSSVTQLNDEQASQTVEIPASVIVPDVRSFALDDDGYVATLVVRGVSGEVHP